MTGTLQAYLNEHGRHPSISMAVKLRSGDVLIPENTDPDRRYLIYSITKTFIAAAILKLVEMGKVELDATLVTYLPDIPYADQFTIRQLLNHNAGLRDYGPFPAYRKAVKETPGTPWNVETFLARTTDHGLAYEPGQGWGYSNIGYMLLKLIIESKSEIDFSSALQHLIFDPLELKRTTVPTTVRDLQTLQLTFSTLVTSSDEPVDVREHYHPGWVSHGVIASTASEVARALFAIYTGQVLPPELTRSMLTPVRVGIQHPRFHDPSYGFGCMIDPASPLGLVVGHGGGGPGYTAAAFGLLQESEMRGVICVLSSLEDDSQVETIAVNGLEFLAI